jgi:hypothetical protein
MLVRRPFESVRLPSAFSVLVAIAAFAVVAPAKADIKDPGDHPKYSVELEPHFLLQWTNTKDFDGDGLGFGGRISIPVIQNGPVPSINNNFAIGVGFDWSHISNDCGSIGVLGLSVGIDCTANHLFFPIDAQWNFFFTPVVGAFTELGLAIQHYSENFSCTGLCAGALGSRSDTTVAPVFDVGGRFILANSFAIVARIGIPYLSVGVSFLL